MQNLFKQDEAIQSSNDKVHALIFESDEVTWQTIIYDLVKSNEMDPWDIDISLLSKKYIEMIQTLKQHDFRISGKVVLAAAILLKIKSNKLVGEDLEALDHLISGKDDESIHDLFDEVVEHPERQLFRDNKPYLLPKTPQPRKRKVSVYDLVHALEKALEVKHRRVLSHMPEFSVELPKKTRDVSIIIRDLYKQIKDYFSSPTNKKLTFSDLAPSSSKEDRVFAFIPLLHLSHLRKLDLKQDAPFAEIEIELLSSREAEAQLS